MHALQGQGALCLDNDQAGAGERVCGPGEGPVAACAEVTAGVSSHGPGTEPPDLLAAGCASVHTSSRLTSQQPAAHRYTPRSETRPPWARSCEAGPGPNPAAARSREGSGPRRSLTRTLTVIVPRGAGADLTDANFEDALIGGEDAKKLCANKSLVGESRFQVGCRK